MGRRTGAVPWFRESLSVTPDTEISTIRRCPSSQYDVYGALPLGSLHQATP